MVNRMPLMCEWVLAGIPDLLSIQCIAGKSLKIKYAIGRQVQWFNAIPQAVAH